MGKWTWKDYEKCKYNESVNCDGCKTCNKCGWNPDVNEKRKQERDQRKGE